MNGENMKKLLSAMAAISVGVAAWAAPVPSELDAALKNLKLQKRTLEGGVLRVVMDVRLVSPEMFSTAVHLVCGERWNSPKAMAATRIDKIEVLNYVDAQGFAFPSGLKGCEQMGKMKSDESEKFLQSSAERCEAGVCRKRD